MGHTVDSDLLPSKLIIPSQKLFQLGQIEPVILGMSYDSTQDELFLVDYNRNVVCSTHLSDNSNCLRVVYRKSERVYNVCYLKNSDILLVCSYDLSTNWLVALNRIGSDWCEAYRLQTLGGIPTISCELSESKVLVGESNSTYMELIKVDLDLDLRLERIDRIRISEEYTSFSAMEDSDTLVATSYEKYDEVRVHRLRENKLEELSRTNLQSPYNLLWLNNRLYVTILNENMNVHSVAKLKLSGTLIELRRELKISKSGNKRLVSIWCAVGNGFAIYDYNSKGILYYRDLYKPKN